MALDFPTSPSNGDSYTFNGRTWKYNGTGWARQGVVNYTASTTAPTSPVDGDEWFDTSTGIFYRYIYDGSSYQWVDVEGGGFYVATRSACSVFGRSANSAGEGADIASSTDDTFLSRNSGALDWTRALGRTTITSGTKTTGTDIQLTSIPTTYAYLTFMYRAMSSDTATRSLQFQASTDNGGSWDTTAGDYNGYTITGTTVAALAAASFITTADVAAANTHKGIINIFGFGTEFMTLTGYIDNGTTAYMFHSTFKTTTIANAFKLLWNGSGSFDNTGSGTYAFYGYR